LSTKAKKTSRDAARAGIDMALVKAISHPERWLALKILNEKVASPTELALEIGCAVNHIAYHVRELAKIGCVELVDTQQRRGATEHFYRAVKEAHFRDEEWLRIPESLRASTAALILSEMGQDLGRALSAGTFEGRADRHCTYTERGVDARGWGEAQDLLTETLERFQEIVGASQERMLETGEEEIRMGLSLLGFEEASKPKR
jgi:predicted ArsR family transcriptional regulator